MKAISTIHVFLTARLVKHEMPVGLTGLNDRDFLMTLTKPMLRSCHETQASASTRQTGITACDHPGGKDGYAEQLFLIVAKGSNISLHLHSLCFHLLLSHSPSPDSEKINHPMHKLQSSFFTAKLAHL